MTIYDKRLRSLPPSVLLAVSRIDELKGGWAASADLAPDTLRTLKRSTLITSTGASTRIEGSRMSDQQIARYLSGLKVQRFAERDSQEVKGYYETLELIFDRHADIDFGENSIKHLHGQLLKYCFKDERHRGDYKRLDNKVETVDETGGVLATVFETTAAYLTPKEMQELVDWRDRALGGGEYHPLLVLSNFIVSFLKIHPFTDGNGRLSRLLTNHSLLRHGYGYVPFVSHERLIEATKGDYYRALRSSQLTFGTKEESIADWTAYFLDVLLRQAEQALDLLKDAGFERSLSAKQTAVWRHLAAADEASPYQIAQATGINRATVSQALNKLVGLRKVERLGQGRSTRYRRL